MLLAEQRALPYEATAQAIECDYEKTPSLEADKKGRMLNFVQELKKQGGTTAFVYNQSKIPLLDIKKAADNFIR